MGKKKENDSGNKISPVSLLYRGVTGVAVVADQGQTRREGGGKTKALRSPLLGSLGGAGWGDRPTRIYTTILVLGLFL